MRLTIGKKLAGGFMAVAVLLIAISCLSYVTMSHMESAYADLIEKKVEILTNSEEIRTAAVQQNDGLREYFLTQNPAAAQKMQTANAQIVTLGERTIALMDRPEDQERVRKLLELNAQYKAKAGGLMILPFDEAARSANEMVFPLAKMMSSDAETIAAELRQQMQEVKEHTKAKTKGDMSLTLILSVVAVLLSVSSGIVISLLTSRPLRRMTDIAKAIAAGDLTEKELKVGSKDEVGELAAAFKLMSGSLRELIARVERSADQVAVSAKLLTASAEQTSAGTRHIVQAAQEVAIGAESQARGAEDSSRAMEEMSAGVQRIAASSAAVAEVSAEASERAAEGNDSVQQAVRQMNAIYEAARQSGALMENLGQRSEEIGQIVEVITGIASQTSLLALNASIEAARAGENGRGFMVVATEVKKLAIQAEEAARQIAEMIGEMQRDTNVAVTEVAKGMAQAESGLEVMRHAGEAFSKILNSVQHVSQQIQEVSATAEEISAGTEEVTASVEETARIAKQSTAKIELVAATSEQQFASMEQITSSAASLSRMAEELQEVVSKFKIS